MKLFLFTALSGILAASAASSEKATLRGSLEEFAAKYPPAPDADTDLKTLWDQLAAEAKLMQVQISEGRTSAQCITACNNDPDVNRARCRRGCQDIRDQGGDSSQRTLGCFDCTTLPAGGRREERCLQSCRNQRRENIGVCMDAFDCSECRSWCVGGGELADCLDEVGNCNGGDRNGRDCETRCRGDSDFGGCVRICDGGDDWDRNGRDCETRCRGNIDFGACVRTCDGGDGGFGNDDCEFRCQSSSNRSRCVRKCSEKKEKLAKKKKDELAKKVYLQ